MLRKRCSKCLSAVKQGKITVLRNEGLTYRKIASKKGQSLNVVFFF